MDGQKQGEIRKDLEPRLILAVLEKLNDLGRDVNLVKMYPSHVELTREVNTVFFYGILGNGNRPKTPKKT